MSEKRDYYIIKGFYRIPNEMACDIKLLPLNSYFFRCKSFNGRWAMD
ncbi:hypothetical protein [Thomasclavelia cocleata]|nr:hypothetical protein [Thomasclavelia cocleata]